MDKKRLAMLCGVVGFVMLCLTAPTYAGFMAEKIDDGLYLVSYERGRLTAGSILDTAKKAQRKLVKKSHEFCLAEHYSYMRFASPAEIGRDDTLQAAWEIFVGDEAADSFQTSGGDLDYAKTHKTRRILILSNTEMDGFERCTFR